MSEAGPPPNNTDEPAAAAAGLPQRVGFVRALRYFLRLGTTGFGGPIATVGYMQRDLVERRGWIDRRDFLDGVALGQTCPTACGAVAMWVGYLRKGAHRSGGGRAGIYRPIIFDRRRGWCAVCAVLGAPGRAVAVLRHRASGDGDHHRCRRQTSQTHRPTAIGGCVLWRFKIGELYFCWPRAHSASSSTEIGPTRRMGPRCGRRCAGLACRAVAADFN